jgi:putative tryptophan/tyrosine transport system substrate-binding protein
MRSTGRETCAASLRRAGERMNKRGAISALLALGAASRLAGVRAQSTRLVRGNRLGVLTLVSAQDAERIWLSTFRATLRSLGWIEGQNLIVESAFAEYKPERLPALVEELIRKRVDVIWTFLPDAAIAAARATTTIPIVFANTSWPVEQGLIQSFARPGRNVTGVATYTGIEVSTKRLEFLKAIAPTATRLSWILGSAKEPTVDGTGFDVRPLLDSAARSLDYEVRYHILQRGEDVDPVLAEVLAWRAQALAVAGTAAVFQVRERIANFALSNRLPLAAASFTLVEVGGLLSYNDAGAATASIAHSLGYVDRILRGARPEDLPVERPSTYELVINLKTAKALGLHVPPAVLLRAGRVIE